MMQGQRVYWYDGIAPAFRPADYGQDPKTGTWWARAPKGGLASLANHEVTEHMDGTITVNPSILVGTAENIIWHGYLVAGVWEER